LPAPSHALSPQIRTPQDTHEGHPQILGDAGTGRSRNEMQRIRNPYAGEELGPGTRGLTTEAEAEANELVELEHQDLIYNLNCFNELNGLIDSAQFSGRMTAGN